MKCSLPAGAFPVFSALLLGLVAGLGTAHGAEPPWPKKTFTYKTVGALAIQADLYRPADSKRRPVVVWIHGGALIFGARTGVPRPILDLCRAQGYALVSLDYRLAPETPLPGIAEDIQDALQWLRGEGRQVCAIDPDRMAVVGGSAGGYLTILAGTRVNPPPRVLVSFWGFGDILWTQEPSEFFRKSFRPFRREEVAAGIGREALASSEGMPGDQEKKRMQLFYYLRQNGLWVNEVTGLDPRKDDAALEPFRPIRHLSAQYPPTLLVHGTLDNDVPYEQSVLMDKELERHHVPHQLVTVTGAGHGLGGADKKAVDDANQSAQDFIRKYLD